MQFRRIGQLVAATTVTAVALSGTHALAQEDTTTISVTNWPMRRTCIITPVS